MIYPAFRTLFRTATRKLTRTKSNIDMTEVEESKMPILKKLLAYTVFFCFMGSIFLLHILHVNPKLEKISYTGKGLPKITPEELERRKQELVKQFIEQQQEQQNVKIVDDNWIPFQSEGEYETKTEVDSFWYG